MRAGVCLRAWPSFYIETNGKRLLFDMGQTGLFVCNAARLGADLGAVDIRCV